ncbi:Aldo/keto reductase [Calocera viscosa TUFC12733]|uniref:Aldo/keto reductase n=1 Tax=Calocera viscosa (strain TUFC12733) TaxID=1330018 RepID=A0A167PVK7_CALVF|nr:Aldo/keto reductase [Calocera viscosa TUFC12733]
MGPARVPMIMGTMTMGEAGNGPVRTSDLKECQDILDVFFKYGYTELDTARGYAAGTTEAYLSKLDLKNAVIDTKVWPNAPNFHKAAGLREALLTSLKTLNRKSVRIFYLHAPDRTTPFEETCAELDKLHKEGLFEILGLSNFPAWEVAEMVTLCKERGWIQPKVYQAMYHALARGIEPELVPALKKYGIRLTIYNPLAGGFLAGKMLSPEDAEKSGRFSLNPDIAKVYHGRYFRDGYFDAIKRIKDAADKHGLRMSEVAWRWCQHHSALGPEDGVILGATSPEQLASNLDDSAKGPLPQDVVDAIDQGWEEVKGYAPQYFR